MTHCDSQHIFHFGIVSFWAVALGFFFPLRF